MRDDERLRIDEPVAAAITEDALHIEGPELEARAVPLEQIERVEERFDRPLASFFLVVGLSFVAAALSGAPVAAFR